MSKKDPVLVAAFKCPEKLNALLLKNYGLPQEPSSRKEVQQDCLPRDKRGRRLTLDEVGESITLKTDAFLNGPEYPPTAEWLRSQAFMRVCTRIHACQRRLSDEERAALLKLVDEWRPQDRLPDFAASLGTPEDFFQRWMDGELEVRFIRNSRVQQTIQIWSTGLREHLDALPPDPDDDLDPADGPPGHWEGLRWISDAPGGPGRTPETPGS